MVAAPAATPLPSGPVSRPGTAPWRRWAALLCPAALLAFGAWLRLANLAANPGWDGDEGYNWSITAHLAAGQAQMFGLRYAFVQHPPFFYILGAALMRLWTTDLIALRALSAVCGVLTIVALFGLGSALGGRRLGLAAAGVYTIWPQAVVQVRWAYTYNLLALLVVAALWAVVTGGTLTTEAQRHRDCTENERKERREGSSKVSSVPPRCMFLLRRAMGGERSQEVGFALLAGLVGGLALATDQEALPLLLALAVLLWPRGGRALVGALLLGITPSLVYSGVMLAIRPADFLFDVRHTAARLDGGPAVILARCVHLVRFDPLIGLGLLGLLALPRPVRPAFVGLAALLTLLIVQVRDPNPTFRAAEPLLPLAALGLGALLVALLRLPGLFLTRRGPARLACVALVVGLGGPPALLDVQGVRAGFVTGLAPVLPRSAAEARAMAAWINTHTRPSDLVIAMPEVAWLLHCRTTELLQAVAITGRAAGFYPAGLSAARFGYDTHLAAARYLVVDTFTRLWIAAPTALGERALVARARRDWPAVYRHGEYVIYANPRP